MGKLYKYEDEVALERVDDVWLVLGDLERYVLAKLSPTRHPVTVTDARGELRAESVSEAHASWAEDSDPLQEIWCHYVGGALSVRLWAANLHRENPVVRFYADGDDSAHARGMLAELLERANRALQNAAAGHELAAPETVLLPSPVAPEENPLHSPEQPIADVSQAAPPERRGLLSNPLAVTIIGGIIATVVAGLILAMLLH